MWVHDVSKKTFVACSQKNGVNGQLAEYVGPLFKASPGSISRTISVGQLPILLSGAAIATLSEIDNAVLAFW